MQRHRCIRRHSTNSLLGIAGFFILLAMEKKHLADGSLFMIYLMLSSTFRFAVEFLRLQPRLALGLSEAQLFSIALFALGGAGLYHAPAPFNHTHIGSGLTARGANDERPYRP